MQDYDEDAEVLSMVNSAVSKRVADREERDMTGRIKYLTLREADVKRREIIVGKKEAQMMAVGNAVDTVLDSLVIAFSVIGIVVSIVFCFGL